MSLSLKTGRLVGQKKTKVEKKIIPLEKDVHRMVCKYLDMKHGELAFHSDFAAASRMTMGQIMANKAIQSKDSWSDLFIAMPIFKKNDEDDIRETCQYCGLFIEIKSGYSKVFKKDGTLKESWVTKKNKFGIITDHYDHLKLQNDFLLKMRGLGYCAEFGLGYDHTVNLIESYLNGTL